MKILARRAVGVAAAVASLAGVFPAWAQTTALPAEADAYLRQGGANSNQGTTNLLQVQSGNTRALLRFDPAAIAQAVGASPLASAHLELFIQSNGGGWGSSGRTVGVFKLSQAWTEAGVTWNCPIDSIPTNSQPNCASQWAGGSLVQPASATALHTNDSAGWISYDVTADVAEFLAGAANHGWLLKLTDDSQSGRVDYGSREATAADRRPRLVIVAGDIAPPSLALTAPAHALVVGDPTPDIALSYADTLSGVDLASLEVKLDGQVLVGCAAGAAAATCPTATLAAGSHTLTAKLRDLAGNEATASRGFRLILGPGPHSETFIATADTFLRKGARNQNQGNESYLRVRAGGDNRSLVSFDFAEIGVLAAAGEIVSAELELYIESNGGNWGSSGRLVGAHRLGAAWTESGATWNCAADSNPENAQPDCNPQWEGGVFAPLPTATRLITNTLSGAVRFDVKADVAALASGGGAPYGWLLRKDDEDANGNVELTSRQGTAGRAPKLFVTFTLPQPPVVDVSPPSLAITAPGALVVGPAALSATLAFGDAESGIAAGSLAVALDGVAIGSCVVSAGGASCPVTVPEGSHLLVAEVKNGAGLRSVARREFRRAASPDTIPPTLEIVAPVAGSTVESVRPEIRVAYQDPGSAVDPSTLVVQIDGTRLYCEAGPGLAVCGSSEVFLAGIHQVNAALADFAGNPATASSSFEISAELADHEAPELTLVSPRDPTVYTNSEFSLTISFRDDDSGVDPATLQVVYDGAPIQGSCTVSAFKADCRRPAAAGNHGGTIGIADRAGNQASLSFEFLVAALAGDTQSPQIVLTSDGEPLEGKVFPSSKFNAEIRLVDQGSGFDIDTLTTEIDGTEIFCTGQALALSDCLVEDLQGGPGHVLRVQVKDKAGNVAVVAAAFSMTLVVDTTPPIISVQSPDPLVELSSEEVFFFASWVDEGSAIDPSSIRVSLDGESVFASCLDESRLACRIPPLPLGVHRLQIEVADTHGHEASLVYPFEVYDTSNDRQAPQLEFLEPAEGAVLVGLATVDLSLVLAEEERGSGIDENSFTLEVDGADFSVLCTASRDTAYCEGLALADGAHTVTARVSDQMGNLASATRHFSTQRETPDIVRPALRFLFPADEPVRGRTSLTIRLGYSDNKSGLDLASFRLKLDGNDLTGSCQVGQQEASCASPSLAAGSHLLEAEIRDGAGNLTREIQTFVIDPQLEVHIVSPRPGFLTREMTTTVSGTVASEAQQVLVGTVRAILAGGTFVAEGVSLHEGSQTLTAVASTPSGGIGADSVSGVRDTQAPRPVFRSPRPGAVTASGEITLVGEVVEGGSSGAPQEAYEVAVNGLPAEVLGTSFVVQSFLLAPGENRITAVAKDGAGNEGESSLLVTLSSTGLARLEPLGGDGQRGGVGKAVAEPLVVRVVDALDTPLAGRLVEFEVTRGDGSVEAFPDAGRKVAVVSDANGVAQASFRLGTRAGVGNHTVTVRTRGVAAEVFFYASAEAGQPKRIKLITGSAQTGARLGELGRRLPQPLLVQVFDAKGNPLPGIAVRFSVKAGNGHFDGQPELEVETDAEGKAAAAFTLGNFPGLNNNVVQASFASLDEAPAVFLISGVEPGPAAATSFSGVVLDPYEAPVPGVTVSMPGTQFSTITNQQGRFQFQGIKPGPALLSVDGTTATRPGTWPRLAFHFDAFSGIENSLGKPIPLPQIDSAGARLVGGEEDVRVPLAGVEGGYLTVFARSVTMPSGAKTGMVSFTQIPRDRVPMPSPKGSNFNVAFSVQPPSTKFDPPARVTLPNTGEAPGTEVDIYSFDHDVGEFVKIGVAAVSADGRLMETEPGFGITSSGWGGSVTSPAPNSSTCKTSSNSCVICTPEGGLEPACDQVCEVCGGNADPGDLLGRDFASVLAAAEAPNCEADEIEPFTILMDGRPKGVTPLFVGVDQEVRFGAGKLPDSRDCKGTRTYVWLTENGSETSEFISTRFTTPGEKTIRLKVGCKGCTNVVPVDSEPLTVTVVDGNFKGWFRLDPGDPQKTVVQMKAETEDNAKFFRGLGGFRLKLGFDVDNAGLREEIKTMKWSGPASGKFYLSFEAEKSVDPSKLAGNTEAYWEGPWTVSSSPHEVIADLELNSGRHVKLKAKIKNRVLKSGDEGDDVLLLTTYLDLMGWEAGPKPDDGWYGVGGDMLRIAKFFGKVKTKVNGEVFEFEGDIITPAVKRMQYRDSLTQSGRVGDTELGLMNLHWQDYRKAIAFSPKSPKVDRNHSNFEVWITQAIKTWSSRYDEDTHRLMGENVSRFDIFKSWIDQESRSVGQWGNAWRSDYVISIGAADGRASIGFDQIQNRYRYGPEAATVPNIAKLNLYVPGENVDALAVFVTTNDGGSFVEAFGQAPKWRVEKTWNADEYPRVGELNFPPVGSTFKEGVYHQLAKGIGGYNQGVTGMGRQYSRLTWPEILKEYPWNLAQVAQPTNHNVSRKAVNYALDIYQRAKIPYRKYHWVDRFTIVAGPDLRCDTDSVLADDVVVKSGAVASADTICVHGGNNLIIETLPIGLSGFDEYCDFGFEYSERVWHAGNSSLSWKQVRDATYEAELVGSNDICRFRNP